MTEQSSAGKLDREQLQRLSTESVIIAKRAVVDGMNFSGTIITEGQVVAIGRVASELLRYLLENPETPLAQPKASGEEPHLKN